MASASRIQPSATPMVSPSRTEGRRLRRRGGRMVVAAAMLVVAVGCAADGPPTPSDPQLAEGQTVFQRNCATCHGLSGGGGSAPALAGRMTERFPDPAEQLALVRDGVPGTAMPAFEGRLTPDELDAVVAYTREGL